jgi:hypothetical protein
MGKRLGRVRRWFVPVVAVASSGVLCAVLVSWITAPANTAEVGTRQLPSRHVTMTVLPPTAGSPAEGSPAGPGGSAASSGTRPARPANFTTLQMNLCNGGEAGCFTDGLAVREAARIIARVKPDLVSLNEVCLRDIAVNRAKESGTLLQAMGDLHPGHSAYSVFVPAVYPGAEDAYRCLNGDSFGNALVFHAPAGGGGVVPFGFVYADQLPTDPEWRTAACAAVSHRYVACTSHLAAGYNGLNAVPTAMKQCNALMNVVVPAVRKAAGDRASSLPAIVQGDFNLRYENGEYGVQRCLPPGSTRRDDGNVQHVVLAEKAAFAGSGVVAMIHTDHVALVVRARLPA